MKDWARLAVTMNIVMKQVGGAVCMTIRVHTPVQFCWHWSVLSVASPSCQLTETEEYCSCGYGGEQGRGEASHV